jgi:diguanylate cyclase (GGDEF)-like protein/PAS domain S-box-containing protein
MWGLMNRRLSLSDAATTIAQRGKLRDRAALLARIGMWECDLASDALTWTDGVYDLFGLPRGSAIDRRHIVGLYHDDSRRDMERLRAEAIRCSGTFTLDAQICTADGETRWMRLSAGVDCEDGRPVRLYGAKQDITEERRAWNRLRRLAECDSLTGLANRGAFEARVRDALHRTDDEVPIAALLIIDIDHFKRINDRWGHAAGDESLRQIAARLSRIFSDADLVARIGGDEFAVLLRAPLDAHRIDRTLGYARAGLSQPLIWNGVRIDIGASIGMALADVLRPLDSVRLFAEADAALYAAKAAGRGTARLFDASYGERAPRRAAGR